MCSSLRWLHISHLTAQHQTNLHLHFSSTYRIRVWWPRPQHIILQPSIPGDVLLHKRPLVPNMPNLNDRIINHFITVFCFFLRCIESLLFFSSKIQKKREQTLTHRFDRNSLVNLLNKLNPILWVFYIVDHVDAISIYDHHVLSAAKKIIIFKRTIWATVIINLFLSKKKNQQGKKSDLNHQITFTWDAPSYNWPSASPTARKTGKRLQQTRIEHEPDTPWHLQTRCIRDLNA